MKGKTFSFIKSRDFMGLFRHLFRKHIVNSLGVPIYSFMVPPIVHFLAPVSRDIRLNGLLQKRKPSDISDYLATLFCEVIKSAPELVVELGTRGGDSTRALLKAVSISGARMLSVDINDCSHVVNHSEFKNIWRFVQADDVVFAGEFIPWCGKNDFPVSIDVLFIDTSHEYEHTLREIQSWFPFLTKNGKVIFHDTNMGEYYRRKNGCIVRGWDNRRGVIRAIEETVGRSYDETVSFVDWQGGWLIEHMAHSSGLTIMTRASHG